MPARSIGTATISFGLVSVPVNIYSSSESNASVSFNMLHKKCGTRLKQQYTCPKDNEVVTRDETVKGYEFAPLSGVDREYLEKVYYLGPDKGGDRAYRLLAAALKETGRAALGQYAARGQQHLVLLRPLNGVLVMEQLHYADELRPTTEVTIPAGDVKEAELKLAKQLIDQTSNETFEPAKYRDTVRERILETIQRKIDGQDITADITPGSETKMLDLMQALKASLAKEKPKEKGESKRKVS
jgi:DNA end-binding protein Ku